MEKKFKEVDKSKRYAMYNEFEGVRDRVDKLKKQLKEESDNIVEFTKIQRKMDLEWDNVMKMDKFKEISKDLEKKFVLRKENQEFYDKIYPMYEDIQRYKDQIQGKAENMSKMIENIDDIIM